MYGWNGNAPLPNDLSFEGPVRAVSDAEFLTDISWLDSDGDRQLEQHIFDEIIEMIREARRMILVDMFLFNDWQGPISENHRGLSGELTAALVEQKEAFPELRVIVISDPINTVYGGAVSHHFQQLTAAGVEVVVTDLGGLNDSNPVYSFIWEWLIRPWGNAIADTLPNPFGAGRVSIRSYLSMINFKANHRKVIVVDDSPSGYSALVTSANPHDGSSAHRNVAVKFSGAAARDVLIAENAVLALSGHEHYELDPMAGSVDTPNTAATIRVVTEKKIKQTALEAIAQAGPGDEINLLMFYLADRAVVKALIEAVSREVAVRVILDVNHDAFGREKNGVPNLPVAQELVENGIQVRWCQTRGEQCHAKMLLVGLHSTDQAQWSMLQGSANFTRRNLDNFNLEANVLLTGTEKTTALADAIEHFNIMWENRVNQQFTVDYDHHADSSWLKKWMYRVMEASGLSTF